GGSSPRGSRKDGLKRHKPIRAQGSIGLGVRAARKQDELKAHRRKTAGPNGETAPSRASSLWLIHRVPDPIPNWILERWSRFIFSRKLEHIRSKDTQAERQDEPVAKDSVLAHCAFELLSLLPRNPTGEYANGVK